jgi:hypothetical protein
MTDDQSVSQPNFLFLSLIIFRQLRACRYGAPSLTRGRVCNFHFFLGIASAVFLGLSPEELASIISLSFIERKRAREEKLGVVVRDTA